MSFPAAVRFYLSILALSVGFLSRAQTLQEHYFSDVERVKPTEWANCVLRDGDEILIGGRSRQVSAAVWRVDTTGTIRWKADLYTTGQKGAGRVLKMIIGADGQIYAIVANGHPSDGSYEVVKLDKQTGKVLWKGLPLATNFSSAEIGDLVDYGHAILVTFYGIIDYGVKDYSVALLDKKDGRMLARHPVPEGLGTMAVDANRNVFIAVGDTLSKRKASDLSKPVWKVSLNAEAARYLGTISRIQPDGDALLAFGNQEDFVFNRGVVARIDTANGSVKWGTATSAYDDVNYSDAKIAGDDLFVAWKHALVGGGRYVMRTSRLNRRTGAVQWESQTNFEGFGAPGYDDKLSEQAALSLDLDAAKNIYVTGYYNSDNYTPATWGIAKLAGGNGQKLYEHTVIEDSSKYDRNSVGVASLVIRSKPYFIGNLQGYYHWEHDGASSYGGSMLMMVQLAPADGKVQRRKYVDGDTVYYASRTVAIKRVSAAKVAVLKEVGRLLRVEMYDAKYQRLWSKTLGRNFKTAGAELVLGADGFLHVTGVSTPLGAPFPTRAVFYRLDTLGNIGKTAFEQNGYSTGEQWGPYQVVKTSKNTHIFYKDQNYYNTGQYLYLLHWPNNYSTRVENSLFGVTGTSAPVLQPLKGDTLLVFQGREIKLLSVPSTYYTSLSCQTLKSPAIPLDQVQSVLPLARQRFIVAGHYRDSSKIFAYDYPTNDTLWKKAYPAATVKKLVAGEKTFVYAAGKVKIGTKTLLRVSKLDAASGKGVWTFTEDSTSHQSEPVDLVFDPAGYVTVVGYATGAGNARSVLICRLDTAGQVAHLVRKESPYGGDNTASCAELVASGEIWLGGNFHLTSWKREGFVYRYAYSPQPQPGKNTPPAITPQRFEVLAGSPAGQTVGKVVTTDAENDALVFAITAGNADSTFTLHRTSGVLSVRNPAALAGGRASFSLTVQVTEERAAPLQSSALVTVVVQADTSLTTGLTKTGGKGTLLVFPNPTPDQVHLSLKNDWYGPVELVLLDELGKEIVVTRLVKRHEELGHVLDLRSLGRGVYLVKLTGGQHLTTRKVFKY